MSRNRALIAALVALVLLAAGLALALSGVTVPAGKDDAVPVEPADANGGAADPTVEQVAPQMPADPAALAAIPPAFRGEWNRDPAACGTGNDESRLRVGTGAVRFYESRGVVVTVAAHDAREAEVTLAMSGEGQTWRESFRFRLSDDGDALTIGGMTRRRCA